MTFVSGFVTCEDKVLQSYIASEIFQEQTLKTLQRENKSQTFVTTTSPIVFSQLQWSCSNDSLSDFFFSPTGKKPGEKT